ncbi:MAG: nidogen-like domain-containing protein [candidate division WOR-3 bacterium]
MYLFFLISFISLNGDFNRVYIPSKELLKPCAKYAPSYATEILNSEFGESAFVLFGNFGFPRLISNFELSVPGKNGLEKAYNFLSLKGEVLGIDYKYLSLIKSIEDELGYTHVIFEEVINGIRVENSFVGVHINKRGNVYYVSSDYFPYDGTPLKTNSRITEREALSIIYSDLSLKVFPEEYKSELVYYPYENSLILVYKIRFVSEYPLGDFVYYIDAINGSIVERRNELKSVYGYVYGWCFPNTGADGLQKYPMANQYVYIGSSTATTNSSGYYSSSTSGNITAYLEGPYVKVFNDDNPPGRAVFTSSGGSVTYTVQNVSYTWDNTTTSTGLTGDDQTKQFTLPFSFPFYGKNYSSVYICTNGFLSFTSNSNKYTPDPIPNTNAPNALIAVFWRDLNPAAGGGSITYYSGSDKFVVTWDNIKNYSNSNRQSFQVVLYPNGNIEFRYKSITNDYTTTRGVENENGTAGVTVSTPSNNTAYRLVPQQGGGGSEVSWEWKYPSDESTEGKHTTEVMVFYHVNKIHDFYKGTFGFTGMDYQIQATVYSHSVDQHYQGANAYYYNGTMHFGRGNSSYQIQNMARSADVIYHEYTHGVVDKIYANAGGLPYSGQSGAMNEAWADYWACTQSGDPVMGEWVMPSQYQRNLQNNYKYPDDWVNEVHDDSRIYSGALWDFRTYTDKTTADRVTWRAYTYYPKDFLAGRNAMIQADKDLYGGSHESQIIQAFARHGIGGSSARYDMRQASYSWVTTSTPTGITGDDQTIKFTLPFSFTFFGSSYSSVYVCSNGWLSFTSNSTSYTPQNMPNSTAPNAVIAPYWRDLYPPDTTQGAKITYASNSSYFAVTWYKIKNYSNANKQTFQAILYKNGTIRFNYQTVTDEYTTAVGIEDANGVNAYLYAYGTGSVLPRSNSAIEFVPQSQVSVFASAGEKGDIKFIGNREVYELIESPYSKFDVYDVSGRKLSVSEFKKIKNNGSGVYFLIPYNYKEKNINKVVIVK